MMGGAQQNEDNAFGILGLINECVTASAASKRIFSKHNVWRMNAIANLGHIEL